MDEIADKSGESDKGEITERPEKILRVITEGKKEIDVADKMDGAGVKKECGQKRESMQTRCLRRNQSVLRHNFVEPGKGKYARDDDRGAKHPCCPGPSGLCLGIEFDRHSQEPGDCLPPFVRRTAVKIGTACLLGKLLDFGQRNRFTRLLR